MHNRSRHEWSPYRPTQAVLVALDISGFSRNLDPDRLLGHRRRFFTAVEETRLFTEARAVGSVRVHFLGDELRLAFHAAAVGAPNIRTFLFDVQANLDMINTDSIPGVETMVRGVVLSGVVTWKQWHGCDYLNGELPLKAQVWMGALNPGEVAANSAFRDELQINGVFVPPFAKTFPDNDQGFMLGRLS